VPSIAAGCWSLWTYAENFAHRSIQLTRKHCAQWRFGNDNCLKHVAILLCDTLCKSRPFVAGFSPFGPRAPGLHCIGWLWRWQVRLAIFVGVAINSRHTEEYFYLQYLKNYNPIVSCAYLINVVWSTKNSNIARIDRTQSDPDRFQTCGSVSSSNTLGIPPHHNDGTQLSCG